MVYRTHRDAQQTLAELEGAGADDDLDADDGVAVSNTSHSLLDVCFYGSALLSCGSGTCAHYASKSWAKYRECCKNCALC